MGAVVLSDITQIDSGASFLNADLHIHSYGGSADVKDATMTPEAIVDSAVAQGLSVISLTDHNTDKNVARALTHAQRHAGKLLLIPGVEVTTGHGHVLVFFAPERTDYLGRFLGKLDLVGEPGGANTHTAKSMADVIALADSLGGLCIAAHIDRDKTGFEMLASGYPSWKRDILTSPGLFGLECDKVDSLKWYSEFDEPGSAGAERRKLMEARRVNPALVGRANLAHVQDSDAHSMAAFNSKDPNKLWTRIKLDELSFAAFRTALVDPSARVVPTRAVPNSIPRLLGCSLSGGFLNGEMIQFSGNLNCFIGGRGTGKSTAVRSLAYCFGLDEEFAAYDSCPDAIVVYCEDGNGVTYRYERARGGDVSVRVKDKSTVEAAADSFRIEFFGQGHLADVAKDPPKTPSLLQAFLDRYISIEALLAEETSLMKRLEANAAQLVPLEDEASSLPSKQEALAELEKKLKAAEEGKLRDVVGEQSRIASEKAMRATLEGIVSTYETGVTLQNLERDYSAILKAAGTPTSDPACVAALQNIKATLDSANAQLRTQAIQINAILKAAAGVLRTKCAELRTHHARMESGLATKIADLKARGLAGNLSELEQLLKKKTSMGTEVAAIQGRSTQVNTLKSQRDELLAKLRESRDAIVKIRKDQLAKINENLARTIDDYRVVVLYDGAGVVDKYLEFITTLMVGTYLPAEVAQALCEAVAPSDLAAGMLNRDYIGLTKASGVSEQWLKKLVDRVCYWRHLRVLEALPKYPKPFIRVLTKTTPSREIPVVQLSDGQRHTILLTIAMLADSNVPLVIDQPEDDLDNEFIFSSIVATLRTIKERRQVIVVTHNSNIAVLGDSELLLPMRRDGDVGRVFERGSIDRESTKRAVEKILEGGAEAFRRRKEMYGH